MSRRNNRDMEFKEPTLAIDILFLIGLERLKKNYLSIDLSGKMVLGKYKDESYQFSMTIDTYSFVHRAKVQNIYILETAFLNHYI